ncbi:hypothetical protein V5F77_04325 [Xanthobacter sp. DSM 24535]|uniref:hypothetical protein n=1 Tax=Roseixanthobacter psychrophilus TaxID=3119917 RepID=UPI00372CC096
MTTQTTSSKKRAQEFAAFDSLPPDLRRAIREQPDDMSVIEIADGIRDGEFTAQAIAEMLTRMAQDGVRP